MLRSVRKPGLGQLPRHLVASISPRRCLTYDSTLKSLKIGSDTRVIFQGFTGSSLLREDARALAATANARESLEWGTKIVGGVRPGREGEHLGLPVLPSVRKAMEVLKPDATGIYVAAHQAAGAIEEAIEAEVPLIVAVAEHIPLHDILRIHSMLKAQSACRLVGANSPGIISAVGKCRIGFQPLPCFEPGRIGIVARSGTLSYEAAASTLRSGLGQTMCIGIGGDILPGTSIREGLQILIEDNDTEGIALIGEIGGDAELEAADWIREYQARTPNPKPIAALIGGVKAVPGRIMGHAGAFALPGEPSALDKIEALKGAGVAIVNHPSRFGPVLKSMLSGSTPTGAGVTAPGQRRGMHTIACRPTSTQLPLHMGVSSQKRTLYLTQNAAFDLLRRHGVPIAEETDPSAQKLLAVTINKSTRSPCIIASPISDASAAAKFDFAYSARGGAPDVPVASIAKHLGLTPGSIDSLEHTINALVTIFTEKEAFLLETRIVDSGADHTVRLAAAHFGFDDAAFRSCGRQADVQALRDLTTEDPAEVSVEKDGIVYIKLEDGDIGTLCIFVNIFGGLTRGDMIAEGVVLAVKDLQMTVPVVVRIRGTNEKEGQRIIAESGLPLFAFDDFDEAAAKAIELAKGGLHL
ncbi:succinyl-CoA synthetase-like protein [Hypoxylon rubiginosum]|uniref:Succinyl-CoA synthetase-like protein n=1 Tax=Hypoxylon rubiginosum TaxID=110542 RepID=A0ACC0D2V2_9PEZI|nr:succinyl-CoA synthetase-like protein [Hypoxylon rubiginosum]